MWSGTRLVAARGLAAGASSRALSLQELAAALHDLPHHEPHLPHHDPEPPADTCVYVTCDGAGRLSARGGAARATVCARLAPHLLATTALLHYHRAEDGSARLRLVVTSPLAPHAELLVWPDDALLARLDVPVLTPLNIHEAGAGYVCHVCGARYEQPNALKLHVWLSCAPPAPRAAWRRLLALLAAADSRPALTPLALEGLATRWAGPGPRGHVCVFCGKTYSRRYGLKIHVRTHTGYKPLRCRHCARAFGDPSNLNKHLRLHAASGAGTGRHVCARCGAGLARRRDLERHVRACHPAPARAAPAPAT